jgi:hypothetical protein
MLNDEMTSQRCQTDIPAKVGYRNPPIHTRFKPGQSGNPSGRPKGSKNFRTFLQQVLKETVTLREGARVRKMSKREAIVRGLVVGAMKGDGRSIGALIRLAEQTGELNDGNATTGVQNITFITHYESR